MNETLSGRINPSVTSLMPYRKCDSLELLDGVVVAFLVALQLNLDQVDPLLQRQIFKGLRHTLKSVPVGGGVESLKLFSSLFLMTRLEVTDSVKHQ